MEAQQIWLWPEWFLSLQSEQGEKKVNQSILIIGSAFDSSLWQLFAAVYSYLLMCPHKSHLLQQFHLILLPISRKIGENHQFKNYICSILADKDLSIITQDLLSLSRVMGNKLQSTWKILSNRLVRFQQVALDQNWLALKEKAYNYKRDQYLFGALTAQFLAQFQPLPLLQIGTYTFHGIPLGLSIEDLIETYTDIIISHLTDF